MYIVIYVYYYVQYIRIHPSNLSPVHSPSYANHEFDLLPKHYLRSLIDHRLYIRNSVQNDSTVPLLTLVYSSIQVHSQLHISTLTEPYS